MMLIGVINSKEFNSFLFYLNVALGQIMIEIPLFSEDQRFRCPTPGLFAREGVQADDEYIECDGPGQLGKLRYYDYPEIWDDKSKSCILA